MYKKLLCLKEHNINHDIEVNLNFSVLIQTLKRKTTYYNTKLEHFFKSLLACYVKIKIQNYYPYKNLPHYKRNESCACSV